MIFSDVIKTFELIEKTQSRTKITQSLSDLFAQLTPHELSIVCNLSLGQLFPPYVRTQFNIASKTMIKIVASLCDLPELRVLHATKQQGDMGDVLMAHTWKMHESCTISELYEELIVLEKIGGIGSQEEKAAYFKRVLQRLSPIEAKYVVRIVLGKLRLGFSDMTIIDALSWMEVGNKSLHGIIEDAYNVCADIGLIAQTLKAEGIKAIESMKIHVGIPVRPAAAERLPTAQAIIAKMGTCVAEPKFDGFRLQIHIERAVGHASRIHFYSRNLQDMSAMFPDLVHALATINVKSLVCEGEAISFDPNTGIFLPFQETVKRKRKHDIENVMAEFPLKVFLFDLLYYNGISYLDVPLVERRKQLLSLIKAMKSDVIKSTEERVVKTAQELEEYFAENVAAGLEGLVVKRIDAPYQAGKRNFNWIKLKRSEGGHLEDTIDCVILGYYGGQGKRALFGIGALLVGIYNKKDDCFQTIAKIGTGLSDVEWRDVKKRCDAIALDSAPKNVECHKNLIPDVWVSPLLVCQILADEITLSPVHTANKTAEHLGFALRFPRFMGYREDKSPYEATTNQEIRRLYEDQSMAPA
jgi:DNA ligase-1